MNERNAYIRKVGYLVAVAVLLVPLFWLSQPATNESKGGLLAQYREDNGLTQANLGEIDPTSETMKLATLGLGPVAVNMLWEKANYYKKVEDWTNLSATLEQITRLEPNFPSVWEHQGWNLSYNVAVEFDDFHDRYRWIIKGLNFIREGVEFNANSTRLPWFIGWGICGQKIGRADEKVQYRKLFREDDDFHKLDDPSRPRSERDNWLVSRWWLDKAERVVDERGGAIKGIVVEEKTNIIKGNSPLVFYSGKPKSVINYGEAMEEDGIFGEVAKVAWERGGKAWFEFGDRELPNMSNGYHRLNDYERIVEHLKQDIAELDALAPGVREQIREEMIEKLSPDDQRIARIPRHERTGDALGRSYDIDTRTTPNHYEVADRAPADVRIKAVQLARRIFDEENTERDLDSDRDIVNFEYWRELCEMEQDEETLAARKGIFQAEDAFSHARLEQAGQFYEEAFRAWRRPLDKYQRISQNNVFVGEFYETIGKYGEFLHQDSKPFPADFILKDMILVWQRDNAQSMRGKWLPWLDENGVPVVTPAAEPEKPAMPPQSEAAPETKPAPPAGDAASPPASPDKPADKPAAETPPTDKAPPEATTGEKPSPVAAEKPAP